MLVYGKSSSWFYQSIQQFIWNIRNAASLRILASYEAKTARMSNFWTFWAIIQLIIHLFKIQQKAFLKSHCTFYIYGALGKKAFCRILKRWIVSLIIAQCPDVANYRPRSRGDNAFGSVSVFVCPKCLGVQNGCCFDRLRHRGRSCFHSCWFRLVTS